MPNLSSTNYINRERELEKERMLRAPPPYSKESEKNENSVFDTKDWRMCRSGNKT